MSTLTLDTRVTETTGASRREVDSFRLVIGDVKNYMRVSRFLDKGEILEIAAQRFLLMSLPEETKVVTTLWSPGVAPGTWLAALPKETILLGCFMYPGKISISITNPVDNTSELPIHIVAYYE